MKLYWYLSQLHTKWRKNLQKSLRQYLFFIRSDRNDSAIYIYINNTYVATKSLDFPIHLFWWPFNHLYHDGLLEERKYFVVTETDYNWDKYSLNSRFTNKIQALVLITEVSSLFLFSFWSMFSTQTKLFISNILCSNTVLRNNSITR